MLRGLLYDASSEELTQERLAAKVLCLQPDAAFR